MSRPIDRATDGRVRPDARRRVLFVQTQVENAGAQEISRLVATGLAERGHDVRHLFFYARTAGAVDVDAETCAPRRPSGPLSLLRLFAEGVRRIRSFDPDVVFTFQHWGNALGAPLVRAAGGAPVVANQVTAPELVPLVARLLDRCWGRIGLYRLITVNSKETADYFDGHPAAYRRRLVSVPYGCECKTSRHDRAGARAALGLPVEGAIIGCAARLHAAKRLDAAIRILPMLPETRLALAGQGAEADALAELAETLGVADRVHFLGELQPTAIGDLLAALDVFVFPSALETFGLAALEAATAGTPVVAADLPTLRDVLSVDGRPGALFVDPTDTAGFAETVRRVLADRALAEELGDAGRALARRHSLDAMIDAYADLVEAATDGGRPT
ncbi:MAG: glycosyltransferase family 4 protein [Hyphomicrobiales bacterium]|nr:glycosyltransferase family 4 protein [Hyphomicrobiales bacterium]